MAIKFDNTILCVILLLLTLNIIPQILTHVWVFLILGIVINWFVRDNMKSFALAAIIVIFMYLFGMTFNRYEYFESSQNPIKQEQGNLEREADVIQEEGDEQQMQEAQQQQQRAEDIINEVRKSKAKMGSDEYGKIADMQSKLFDASKKMTQTMKTLEPLLAEGIKIKDKFAALGLVN